MKLEVNIEKKLPNFSLKVDFCVETEVFALLGASGSGKSLTLKCIAGIEKPDKGRIVLGERVLFDSEKKINLPARKRKVGYLFQDYALFPKMAVLENIMISGASREEAERYLKEFRLSEKKYAYPPTLSGGQKQRTALARMLASKPELILLDEPYSALDNYLKSMLERELLSMLEKYPMPTVFVSHDRNEVYRIADKVAVLDNGKMQDVQEKNDFFKNPKSVSTARLTGCKNITALQSVDDGVFFANDWGIKLRLFDSLDMFREEKSKIEKLEKAKYAGYLAHYFIKKDVKEDYNCFDCEIIRIIEDTFSTVILFKQKGYDCPEPLYWEVSKDEAEEVLKDGPGSLYLMLDSTKLILLEK